MFKKKITCSCGQDLDFRISDSIKVIDGKRTIAKWFCSCGQEYYKELPKSINIDKK